MDMTHYYGDDCPDGHDPDINWAEGERGSPRIVVSTSDVFISNRSLYGVKFPDDEANSLIEQVIQANQDRAYDGSNKPQRRALTARERDILCRVIRDIITHGRHDPPTFSEGPIPSWQWSPVPIVIGEDNFFQVLDKIRRAIDPREEG